MMVAAPTPVFESLYEPDLNKELHRVTTEYCTHRDDFLIRALGGLDALLEAYGQLELENELNRAAAESMTEEEKLRQFHIILDEIRHPSPDRPRRPTWGGFLHHAIADFDSVLDLEISQDLVYGPETIEPGYVGVHTILPSSGEEDHLRDVEPNMEVRARATAPSDKSGPHIAMSYDYFATQVPTDDRHIRLLHHIVQDLDWFNGELRNPESVYSQELASLADDLVRHRPHDQL